MKSKVILDPGFGERREKAPIIWILRSVGAQISILGTPFGDTHTNEDLYKCICVCLLLTSKKEEQRRKGKKDDNLDTRDCQPSYLL